MPINGRSALSPPRPTYCSPPPHQNDTDSRPPENGFWMLNRLYPGDSDAYQPGLRGSMHRFVDAQTTGSQFHN